MNILEEADRIVNYRSEEKSRQYGDFDESMTKAALFASELTGIYLKLKKMNLTNEFYPIRDWAKEKGIIEFGDCKTQCLKLIEEVGELSKAILKNDEDEFIDAVGDCVIVLSNLAAIRGYNIEFCINSSYNVIKERQGKMQNGTFVKNK